jgi:hypothetical protein
VRPLTLSFILTLFFLTGCSTTWYVPQDAESEEFVNARAKLHMKDATVTLLDGTEIYLESTSLQPTAVVGVKEDTSERQNVPLSDVKEIRTTHIGRGAIRGMTRGAIICGSISLAAAIGSVGSREFMAPQSAGDVLAFGLAGAFSGALYGAITGMVSMSTEHYRFAPDNEASPDGDSKESGRMIQLKLLVLEHETSDAIGITWDGRLRWVPKSRITIQRTDEGFILTLPERYLEEPSKVD